MATSFSDYATHLEKGRGAHQERVDAAWKLVQDIIDNRFQATTVTSAHWDGGFFREAVLSKLRQMKALEEQAHQLHVVKSVFSGKS